MANALIAETQGKALYVGLFVGQGSNGNDKFKNATSNTLSDAFETPDFGGVPDFGANGVGKMVFNSSGLSTAQSKAAVLDAVNTFAASVPQASPANIFSISDNTVAVTAKAQFWAAANGEYYLAAYLIEDGALNLQANQSGIVAHHGVMRGSMSATAWGEQIANGAVTANQSFSKTFTFNVTDATWDKTKFKVYTVIWKKNGAKYEFINASENEPTPNGIASIAHVEGLSIFPNPAVDKATLSITAATAMDISIQVTDISGRKVYVSENNKVVKGNNNFELPIARFNNGMYNVTVTSKDGKMNQRLVISK